MPWKNWRFKSFMPHFQMAFRIFFTSFMYSFRLFSTMYLYSFFCVLMFLARNNLKLFQNIVFQKSLWWFPILFFIHMIMYNLNWNVWRYLSTGDEVYMKCCGYCGFRRRRCVLFATKKYVTPLNYVPPNYKKYVTPHSKSI